MINLNEVTIQDVIQMANNKEFEPTESYPKDCPALPKSHVFDMTKSVIWNRNNVEQYNNERIEKLKAWESHISDKNAHFRDVLVHAIMNDYNLPESAAQIIFNYGYDEGHSCGHISVAQECDKVAELIDKVRSAM